MRSAAYIQTSVIAFNSFAAGISAEYSHRARDCHLLEERERERERERADTCPSSAYYT